MIKLEANNVRNDRVQNTYKIIQRSLSRSLFEEEEK